MSNEDKRTDEIVEEIMQSIYDDLDNLDKEKETGNYSWQYFWCADCCLCRNCPLFWQSFYVLYED